MFKVTFEKGAFCLTILKTFFSSYDKLYEYTYSMYIISFKSLHIIYQVS